MTAVAPKSRVLREYYRTVTTLSDYLDALIPSRPHQWVQPEDPESFRRLLSTTQVGTEKAFNEIPQLPFYLPICPQDEIMCRAHESLFKNIKGKPSNVLAFGYKASVRSTVSNYITNPMVESLVNEDWALLLQRIGEAPMFHLLTSIGLFFDLGNDNFYQAAGVPIYSMRPLAPTGSKRQLPPDFDTSGKISKKRRLEDNVPTQKNSPVAIEIIRRRLFYGKPQRRPRSHGFGLQSGLPSKHILNQVAVKIPKADEHLERAWLVAKYIFPRQYGLHNVFTFEKEKGAWGFRDYSSRDKELSEYKGPAKIPRRVHQAAPLIVQLIRRHRQTKYYAILQRACTSKLKEDDATSIDPAEILDLMSEAPQVLATQLPMVDISDISLKPTEELTIGNTLKHKPRFAEFICSHREVSSFAITVTDQVIPSALWGSDHNYQLIKEQITNFVSYRRFESVTLHSICQNLKFLDFAWALASLKDNKSAHRSLSDISKGRELVEEFLYWYFDSFLMPLLKTNFYCTESAAFKNQVLYFRQDDWRRLCRPLIDRLCSTTFERISGNSNAKSGKLGFSHVRLLPKETGVRPVVNLRRKQATGLSINQILQAAFQVLSFERDREAALQGAAVTGHTEIHLELKAFKQRHSAPDGKLPKLYFVKVDVRACFDTIEQGKLLEIIQRIVKEDNYLIQRYSRVSPNTRAVKRQFCRRAIPDGDDVPFMSMAIELAASLRHVVFTDQVTYPRENRDALLSLLEEHITSNIVKIGSAFYKQRIGIPQGSVLSTLLCNVLYGDLEASQKFKFTEDVSNLLLRYVDDYLFITTELEVAKQFLDMMNQGHPEYGCFISREKTVTNFEHGDSTISTPCSRELVWCGLSIHLANLNVTMNCSRLAQYNLADSLTVGKGQNPGKSFRYKVLRMAKMRSHVIFTDAGLNSAFTIHLNIYENFLLTAVKIMHYVIKWGVDVAETRGFLEGVLLQAITYAYRSIKSRQSTRVMRGDVKECIVIKTDVLWLGFHAFELVFSRKRVKFMPVLRSIKRELCRSIYIGLRRSGKFDSVIRTGIERSREFGI